MAKKAVTPMTGVMERMRLAKRGSRYKAARTTVTCLDNIERTFASRAEAYRYLQLERLQQAGVISGLKNQPEFPIIVNGVTVAKYIADTSYVLLDSDGRHKEIVIEDVKSSATAANELYRLKKALVEAIYGIKIKERNVSIPGHASRKSKRKKKKSTTTKQKGMQNGIQHQSGQPEEVVVSADHHDLRTPWARKDNAGQPVPGSHFHSDGEWGR